MSFQEELDKFALLEQKYLELQSELNGLKSSEYLHESCAEAVTENSKLKLRLNILKRVSISQLCFVYNVIITVKSIYRRLKKDKKSFPELK